MEYTILETNSGDYFIRDERGTQFCEGVKTLANAQLISAAPDLYEACVQAMRTLQARGIRETDPRYLKLRLAITKAEGRDDT